VTPPRASRRTALGALALLPLLAACSGRVDDAVDRLRAPETTPPAPPNPDAAGVAEVARAIADVRDAISPHAGSQPVVADLVALHAAHLHALAATPAAGTMPGTAPTLDRSRLLAEVRTRESALAQLVTARAIAAHDPALARLLASMAAAIGQRTAELAG
jgi:hypothetical protein